MRHVIVTFAKLIHKYFVQVTMMVNDKLLDKKPKFLFFLTLLLNPKLWPNLWTRSKWRTGMLGCCNDDLDAFSSTMTTPCSSCTTIKANEDCGNSIVFRTFVVETRENESDAGYAGAKTLSIKERRKISGGWEWDGKDTAKTEGRVGKSSCSVITNIMGGVVNREDRSNAKPRTV